MQPLLKQILLQIQKHTKWINAHEKEKCIFKTNIKFYEEHTKTYNNGSDLLAWFL